MRDDFKYVTVVYRVTDHAAFEARWNEIHELMALDDGPVRVTAISLVDEITRQELMVKAAEDCDDPFDLQSSIHAIWNANDVHKIALKNLNT